MNQSNENIVWHPESVTRKERESLLGQKGHLLFFTGLSGSGKSTVAQAFSRKLYEQGRFVVVLDGDNIRHGLCKDLGFSDEDRQENIRRLGEVAKLFVDQGIIVCTAFISPFRSDRQKIRELFPKGDFSEVFVDCPFEECARRDPKGLYAKAQQGKIEQFTGKDSGYESPDHPEVHLKTDQLSLSESVEALIQAIL